MGIQSLIESDRGKSATFETIGTSYAGRITASTAVQARSYTTNEPEAWDDGSARMQAAITIQTDLRDPTLENDDGARTVYIKWWGPWRKALQEALRQAGDTDIRVGGWFSAQYTGNGEATKGSPPKLFVYQYQKPAPQGTGLTGTTPPAAPPAPPAVPVTYAPPSPPAQYTPPAATTTYAPPPPPPAAALAPPPPPPAVDPAAAKALMDSIKAYQAAGWTDPQILDAPAFAGKGLSLATLASVRNVG